MESNKLRKLGAAILALLMIGGTALASSCNQGEQGLENSEKIAINGCVDINYGNIDVPKGCTLKEVNGQFVCIRNVEPSCAQDDVQLYSARDGYELNGRTYTKNID